MGALEQRLSVPGPVLGPSTSIATDWESDIRDFYHPIFGFYTEHLITATTKNIWSIALIGSVVYSIVPSSKMIFTITILLEVHKIGFLTLDTSIFQFSSFQFSSFQLSAFNFITFDIRLTICQIWNMSYVLRQNRLAFFHMHEVFKYGPRCNYGRFASSCNGTGVELEIVLTFEYTHKLRIKWV